MRNVIQLQFQFHKGTIRTEVQVNNMKTGQKFQFHKGTIRTFINIK